MPVKRNRVHDSYGMGSPLQDMSPLPIIAVRAPTTSDFAELGTTWVDTPNDAVYVLTSITSNSANWSTSPASGVGTFTAVTINPGDLTMTAGDIIVSAGTLTVAVGLTTLQDLNVSGTLTFTGDLDLTSAALIDLTSTLDAAPSILLRANGGVSEQIRLHSDQGTSVNSVELDSDVGGITLVSGLASADAINLTATAGGVDIDGALQVNIASSQNAASAIVINASAGGVDITNTGTAGEDIDIVSTGASVNISATESASDSITIISTAGGIDISASGAAAGEDIDIVATGSSVNIESTEADGAAVVINASNAAGGVQIQAGTTGILMGNQADCTPIDVGNIAPTASRTITVGGGTVVTASVTDTIDIAPDGATTNADSIKTVNIGTGGVTTGENNVNIGTGNRTSGTHLVAVSTGTGTKIVNLGNADGLTTFNVDGITLINDSLNVNTSINTGTSTGSVLIGNNAAGAITMDSAAGIGIDAAAASNFTVTGAGLDLALSSVGGSVLVAATEDAALAIRLHADGGVSETIQIHSDQGTGVASIDLLSDVGGITLTSTGLASADAINLNAAAGGIDIDAALLIDIDSAQAAAADSIRIVASAADGGIDVDSGTGGLTLDSTGAISIDGAAASNMSVSGAGIDLSLVSTAGRVIVNGEEAAANAITLLSAAGGIDCDAALQINIASSQSANDSIVIESSAGGIDILASGAAAGEDIDIVATGSSINITSTEAISSAIVISASNAAGGVTLDTGGGALAMTSSGNVTMEPGTSSVAGTSLTLNARVGVATFTGLTTGAGVTEDFTITNSSLGAGDGIFVTVSNKGSNDADMTLEGVITQTAGTLTVHTQNNGAAALNGDVIITFWIIN